MEVKPLHVRVAEALGWECWFDKDDIGDMDLWLRKVGHTEEVVPRYDIDWSATGLLIEKYGINVVAGYEAEHVWTAAEEIVFHDYQGYYLCGEEANGPTPLIAVCNLILALKEAGKL